ncbi:MAG: hypothetical protein R3E12_02550 [Candidatus Eisenbacteria bacterium]
MIRHIERRGLRFATGAVAMAAALAASFLVGSVARADVPEMVNYQGFLQSTDGTPVDGAVSIRFNIYDRATGGNLVWTETHSGVVVDEGLFHVVLGSTQPLTEPVFDGTERWLETILAGEPALTPRRQFLATPYALHAVVADVALSGGEGDDDWTIDGDHVYRDTGTVSIGTAVGGSQSLYVASDVVIGGGFDSRQDGGAEFLSVQAQSDDWVVAVQNEATAAETDLYIGLDANAEDGMFHIEHGGDIGIGTTSPSNKLTVVGDVGAESFSATTPLGEVGQPAVGGVYSDNVIYAWGTIAGDGTILDGFGIAAVNHFSTGNFEVLLERTLPECACATVTARAVNDPVLTTANALSDRVDIRVRLFIPGNHNFSLYDYGFYFQVVGRPN